MTRRNRQTDTDIELIDNRDESFEVGGYSWITLCQEHGNYCEHETKALAISWCSAPADWCAGCEAIITPEAERVMCA
jgi:hypothetical protein